MTQFVALMIDPQQFEHINIHQTLKKTKPQTIARSRGGLSRKIHAAVGALGYPVRWLLMGGEVVGLTQTWALIDGFKPQAVLADKVTMPMA